MINAGQLSNRITLQTSTETLGASGQPLRTWATFGTANLPAKVETVTGGETIRGRQVSAEAAILFTIRWLTGATTAMRVSFDGRTLGIVRVSDPYGDRRELRIECKEA